MESIRTRTDDASRLANTPRRDFFEATTTFVLFLEYAVEEMCVEPDPCRSTLYEWQFLIGLTSDGLNHVRGARPDDSTPYRIRREWQQWVRWTDATHQYLQFRTNPRFLYDDQAAAHTQENLLSPLKRLVESSREHLVVWFGGCELTEAAQGSFCRLMGTHSPGESSRCPTVIERVRKQVTARQLKIHFDLRRYRLATSYESSIRSSGDVEKRVRSLVEQHENVSNDLTLEFEEIEQNRLKATERFMRLLSSRG